VNERETENLRVERTSLPSQFLLRVNTVNNYCILSVVTRSASNSHESQNRNCFAAPSFV